MGKTSDSACSRRPAKYNGAMNRIVLALLVSGLSAWVLSGSDASAPTVSKIFERQLSTVESELVPLAEAMPADKYGFAPSHGEFHGVRTFGQQVSHVAAVIYAVSASVLEEKNPSESGESEN